MRLVNLIKGDMRFQLKHGFYLIYAVLSALYICIIVLLPKTFKEIVTTYIIFTDPVTAGLFFMGAIILFEKSQRVLNSLAVSPVKVSEYIISKVISLAVLALSVGLILTLISEKTNIFTALLGIFMGSILFTLISLVIAPKINSINQFMLYTIPIGIICFIPSIYYLFFSQKNIWLLHPCNSVLFLINYNSDTNILLPILLLGIWIFIFYATAYKSVLKMFKGVGGIKL